MRKQILILFLLMLSTLLFAQKEFTFGIKGGTNFTGYHTGSRAITNQFGINFGGIAEYSLSNRFKIQAELLFNQKAGTFTIRNNSNFVLGSVISKLGYIDIPVLAKVYINDKFSFEVGPQIGFNISEKTEFNGSEVESELKNLDTAIVGGFGYQFEQGLFIQARYGYGLSEVFKNEKYKNSVISLSLGYKFN
jgi:hypothetical protein